MRQSLLLLAMASTCVIPTVHAQTFMIDSTQSFVRTTNWSNWPWSSWGPPEDVIESNIGGRFDLLIEPGGHHIFTGEQAPDWISFNNAQITYALAEGREWSFPNFKGLFFNPDFEGSSDGCFAQSYYSWGSCWSAGNFATFTGTYDGNTLVIKGGEDSAFGSGNAYIYEIHATAVPEPETVLFIIAGLLALTLRLRSHKLSPV